MHVTHNRNNTAQTASQSSSGRSSPTLPAQIPHFLQRLAKTQNPHPPPYANLCTSLISLPVTFQLSTSTPAGTRAARLNRLAPSPAPLRFSSTPAPLDPVLHAPQLPVPVAAAGRDVMGSHDLMG